MAHKRPTLPTLAHSLSLPHSSCIVDTDLFSLHSNENPQFCCNEEHLPNRALSLAHNCLIAFPWISNNTRVGVSVGALPVLFEGSFCRSLAPSLSVRMQVTFPEFVGGGAAWIRNKTRVPFCKQQYWTVKAAAANHFSSVDPLARTIYSACVCPFRGKNPCSATINPNNNKS